MSEHLIAPQALTTNTSRRMLLAGTAAAVVAGTVSAAAAPAGTAILELIEAHKVAFARLNRALDTRDDIEEAVGEDRRKNPVLVPMAVMPNGKCYSGYYELGPLSPADIQKGIRETHDSLRRIHCSKWSRVMFPQLAVAAERELEASQERALQALADAEAGIEAKERDAGLAAAQEAVNVADEEEFKARLSLAVCPPRNAAEAAMKRSYIEQSPPFRDGWCSDNAEFVDAMIARIGELASA